MWDVVLWLMGVLFGWMLGSTFPRPWNWMIAGTSASILRLWERIDHVVRRML